MEKSNSIAPKQPISDLKVTLAELYLNDTARVEEIHAGQRATQRLSGMGITPGTKIKVLSQAPFRGPVQIEVRGTRLALGQGLVRKIIVVRL